MRIRETRRSNDSRLPDEERDKQKREKPLRNEGKKEIKGRKRADKR